MTSKRPYDLISDDEPMKDEKKPDTLVQVREMMAEFDKKLDVLLAQVKTRVYLCVLLLTFARTEKTQGS